MKEETKKEIKKEGMELIEDITVETIEHVFNFAKKCLDKNVTLKTLVPVLDVIKNFLLKEADKIDGITDVGA